MKRKLLVAILAFSFGGTVHGAAAVESVDLVRGFTQPPPDARLRAYWWWLNGNVTVHSITRDLEEMKAKGFGGAVIFDADGSSQDGNARVKHGPTFFSPEWRALYRHALREADRLGLEMSLNIQSGWNLGGPMVKAEDAPKKLVWTKTRAAGGARLKLNLARPKDKDGFYHDLFVLAIPVRTDPSVHKPLKNLPEKGLLQALKPFSSPDSAPLFAEETATPGEQDFRNTEVLDLTKELAPDGTLDWAAPAGEWLVLRFGCTLNESCHVSTSSEGWEGYAIDPFDDGAFRRYWDAVVEPLIADAGPLAGSALKYLHTDSWEIEVANWTPSLREEFRKRRGYDLLPWLPVIAGSIVNSRDESDRFLNDFRKTFGDLAIDHHYKPFKEGAHKHGLLIHPESGGPHAVPIDAQRCLGFNDAPMSEFWARSWRHRVADADRFFMKQPASAAHTYGRKFILAEGFTTIGPHWQETLWDNLKPSFDKACCEGMNRLVWCTFVSSPESEGVPGQQLFAGTHVNPNVTWWSKSEPFFTYLNRCQFLLQQGLFVADVAYYYGDHVPNFARLKASDPAGILPGYDYDVVTEEVLLTRMNVKDGRLVLPDGMSYRVLVLRDLGVLSPAVLRKLQEFVAAGATIIGERPVSPGTLTGFPNCDAEFQKLTDNIWSNKPSFKGWVVTGRTTREVLLADGVPPDFEFSPLPGISSKSDLDYIHRRDGNTDIYFVANRSTSAMTLECTFRIAGKVPELWNPVTGERRSIPAYQQANGRTILPLELAPCGSWFVVFQQSEKLPPVCEAYAVRLTPITEISGPWTVRFDPKWGGPESVRFDELADWTSRPEPGIRFYSGTATYTKTLDRPAAGKDPIPETWLDLGNVHELAEVRVNGKSCGIVWTPPFRVNITGSLKAGSNTLEVDVVNFWPNRLIGDASLPPEKRFTETNIRKLIPATSLMPSGLLGPVTLQVGESIK